MRIDRYTKVVLTIIAACLVWLSVGGVQVFLPAYAQVLPASAPKAQVPLLPAPKM